MLQARLLFAIAGLLGAAWTWAPTAAMAQVDAPAAATLTQPALTIDDVALNVRVNLEGRDSALSALVLYTLRTRRAGRIRWTKKNPLVLPLLGPAVRRVVLDRGVIPKGARHVQIKAPKTVTVEARDGSMVLIGELASGKPLDLRLAYPIAALTQELDLGLRGVAGETSLAVAAIGVIPVRLRLQADRAARVANHQRGGERYAALSLTRPLRRGETAVIRVMDIPAAANWPGRTLAGLGLLIAVGIGSGLFRRRSSGDWGDDP